MGWIHDVPEDGLSDHEGYCVALLPTGQEPDPVPAAAGATPGNAWWLYDGSAPDRPRAAAVRAACACGWRSRMFFPVDLAGREKTEGTAPERAVEHAAGSPFDAWTTEHLGQLLATRVPAEVTEAITALRRLLTGLADSRPLAAVTASTEAQQMAATNAKIAVMASARAGSSWDAIGDALGVTRQAAHQRYAKLAPSRHATGV